MDPNELGFPPVRRFKLWRGAHWASPALSWLRLSRSLEGSDGGRTRTSILDDPAFWGDEPLLPEPSKSEPSKKRKAPPLPLEEARSSTPAAKADRRPLFSAPRPLPEILRNAPAEEEVPSTRDAVNGPAAGSTAQAPSTEPLDAPEAKQETVNKLEIVKEEPEEDPFDICDSEIEDGSLQNLELPEDKCRAIKIEDGESTRQGKKPKATRPSSKARLKRPQLPQFAFEIFKQECKAEDDDDHSSQFAKKELTLARLVQKWKELKEEDMHHYIRLADEDRQRFEREYEEWRTRRATAGKKEESLQVLLDKRRATLENTLARFAGVATTGTESKPKRQRRQVPKPPPGFPKQPVKSGYALFCSEQKAGIAARMSRSTQEAAAVVEGEPSEPKAEPPQAKPKGVAVLGELKKAWGELSAEEMRQYAVRAAEDQDRFRRELEAWQADPANHDTVEESVLQEAMKLASKTPGSRGSRTKQKLPRPLAREADFLARPAPTSDSMWSTMTELQMFANQGKRQRASADAANARQLADASLHPEALPLPVRAAEEEQPPVDDVDDLLGDLLSVEAEQAQASREASYGNAEAFLPSLGLPLGDQEEGMKPSQALGPQLCLDESGNIVLNQSSLSQNLTNMDDPLEEGAGGVQEAVSQYTSAYKKTPACRWTDHETQMFYEALSLYGTDLFLVQTFFRNKSAGQIKTKYSKELKKHPDKVQEALTTKARKLTKDTFEKVHGKIDTSKHFKPPPTPDPGENPEPDGHVEEEDDELGDLGGMPPPEPEYSAEDESLTTNRLMALFD